MASSINASTAGAGGVIVTSDNSGVLNLQSGGNTVATVQSSGLSLPTNSTFNAANTFGFKNRLINGSFVFAQRGTSFTGISTDAVYTLDRWAYAMNGGGAVSSSQASVTGATAGQSQSILTTVTTADATVSAASYYQLRQPIEGYNIVDLAWGTASAKTVTASFWVYCSVTGNFTFSLRNTGGAVSYVTTYNIPTANTWTYITITVPGPTTGTWDKTNGTGIYWTWDLGTGSNSVTSSTNTWISGNYTGATGAVKLINTNGATFYVQGAQLEVGSQATSFDFRDYGRELILCQRYNIRWGFPDTSARFTAVGYGGGGTTSGIILQYPVTMRAAPTFTYSLGSGLTVNDGTAAYAVSSMSGSTLATSQSQLTITQSTSITSKAASIYANATDFYINLSAEL